jgi:hypothetical protein
VAEREGDHPLLDQHTCPIRHPWGPTFPGPQDLGAVPVQLPLPPVEGGGVDAHGPAGRPQVAELGGDGEGPSTEPVQRVILGHGDASLRLDLAVSAKEASPFCVSGGYAQVSLHLGDRTP